MNKQSDKFSTRTIFNMVKFLPPIFTNFKNYDHIIQTLLLNIKINMKDTEI